jgi:hypothetical protein
MDPINPIAISLYQSTQVQEQQAVDKQRKIRKSQTVLKNAAAQEDEFEHQVESTEEVAAIHDQPPGQQESSEQEGHPKENGEEPPKHLDLTA